MVTTTELRHALGRIGIWMPPMPALGLDPGQYGHQIESQGFRSVWFPGVNDVTSLDAVEATLAGTSTLFVGTGIASVWHWDPADLAARADRLAASYGDRFILGLGNSHASVVQALGQEYVKPYSKTVEFLNALPETRAPLVLAALGPKMLELAAGRTLGAHPYFTPPEHTAFARQAIGPQPLLIPEVAVSLTPGADGEANARAYAQFYLRLPNYAGNLRRFGFTDADIAGSGSDQLIATITPNGPAESLTRIRQHLDAGADHVVVQLLGPEGKFAPGSLGELAELAADLLA
ncbi:MAG TPA: TIGR03620 family F420-dependent LLM class oxidoreductase [Trebonia sp.]|nr:TIGR03620 family F420-dependent LLM class oxidoreductase [Trebonia sp.]